MWVEMASMSGCKQGDGGRLSLVAAENCAGIAALETLKLLGRTSCAVGLTLRKACCPPDEIMQLDKVWKQGAL